MAVQFLICELKKYKTKAESHNNGTDAVHLWSRSRLVLVKVLLLARYSLL